MCAMALAVVKRVVVGFAWAKTVPVITDEIVAVLDDTFLPVAKATTKSRVRVVDACVDDSDADALSGSCPTNELAGGLMIWRWG